MGRKQNRRILKRTGYPLDARIDVVIQEGKPFAAIYPEESMSVSATNHIQNDAKARAKAGAEARHIRESLGLSRRQVAEAINMSEGRIYQLENGTVSLDNAMFDKLAAYYTSERAPSLPVVTKKNCKRCGSSRDIADFKNENTFCDSCEDKMSHPTPKRNVMDDPGATLPMMGNGTVEVTPQPTAPPTRESIIEWLGQQLKDERAKTAAQAARIVQLEEIVQVTQEELGMFQEENQALEARIKELETPKAPAVTSTEAELLSSLGCPGFGG